MNFLAISIPCWLIPAIVGLICAILGYLLGKLLSGKNNNDCDERIEKLQTELDACKLKKTALESDLSSTKASLATSISNATAASSLATKQEPITTPEVVLIPFDADAAKAVFGKKIKQDNLTVVEGIGPKIQELFHNNGVKTWKALSECSIEKCQEVLKSGGDRFKMHKPGTWPKQSKLAYEGKWEELLNWQDQLDGGK